MVTFAVYTFEGVRTQFTLFGFEMWRVQFEVGFVAPGHISVMFNLVGASTFLTLGAVRFAREGYMIPFPAIVTLRHSWIYISTSNVINRPPEPKIVRLEGWEERELFSDGLDEGF